MRAPTIRQFALALVALLVHAQASVAAAGCSMDRAEMAQTAAHACCELQVVEPGPMLDSVCVAHCTADLQRFEARGALARAASASPVLAVPEPQGGPPQSCGSTAMPVAVVPLRILFQSFLA